MGYSPLYHKQLDTTEQISLSYIYNLFVVYAPMLKAISMKAVVFVPLFIPVPRTELDPQ